MDKPKIECRNLLGSAAELRLASAAGRRVTGYAAKYNSLSSDLGGFLEKINPGAFDRALREKQDVLALYNHRDDFLLGRVKSGSLKLSGDSLGLRVDLRLPQTNFADDLLKLIERGDVGGMSFAFIARKDNWRKDGGGALIRVLEDVDLFDVSIVARPAYPAAGLDAPSSTDNGDDWDMDNKRKRLQLAEAQIRWNI